MNVVSILYCLGFREANKAGSGMQIGKTEYKPIFPKSMSDTSTLNSMYGSADNKSYGSAITSLPIKSEPKVSIDNVKRKHFTCGLLSYFHCLTKNAKLNVALKLNMSYVTVAICD